VLHKDQLVSQLKCDIVKGGEPLPWENESNNLPLSYIKNQVTYGKTPEFYQNLV